MLINRVASLEQSLYWLRKKVLGRINEKSFPLGPNQLLLFLKEEMSSMEIFRIEEEVRKNEEEITKNIKVKIALKGRIYNVDVLVVSLLRRMCTTRGGTTGKSPTAAGTMCPTTRTISPISTRSGTEDTTMTPKRDGIISIRGITCVIY